CTALLCTAGTTLCAARTRLFCTAGTTLLRAAVAALLCTAGTTPKANNAPSKPMLSASTLTVIGFLIRALLPDNRSHGRTEFNPALFRRSGQRIDRRSLL